jgi:hypothetical protein
MEDLDSVDLPSVIEALRALGSCSVSNAVERLDVRLRNEGFMTGATRIGDLPWRPR